MKTQEQLNADTLFAFQMALKGHKQFEYLSGNGKWYSTFDVSAGTPHRIYHDIPDGWTRNDGEGWKGDKDAVIEDVMFCDGRTAKYKDIVVVGGVNNFTTPNHYARIYAYKLKAKSPEIPEGFTKHDGGKLPIDGDLRVEAIRILGSKYMGLANHLSWTDIIAYRVIEKKVIPWTWTETPLEGLRVKRKRDGKNFNARFQVDGVLTIGGIHESVGKLSYETLAADYLQLDGSVCGKEVEQ